MRRILFCVSFFALLYNFVAEAQYRPYEGWVGTPRAQIERPEGNSQIQILQKYALSASTPFLVGSLIYIHAPKVGYAKVKTTTESLTFLKDTMNLKAWITRTEKAGGKDIKVYEAYWNQAHRYVRIFLDENEKEISYSIATFRPSFGDSAGYESLAMQRHLFGISNNKTAKLPKIQMLLAPQSAWAAQDPVCLSSQSAAAQSTCSQYVNYGQVAVDSCVQQFVAGACPDVGNTGSTANTNTNTGTNTGASVTPSVGGNGIQVDASSVLNSPNGQTITNSISSASSSLKTYEKLFNVDYLISGTAAVLTTGFVFGAITDGVAALASFVKELVTNAKDNKARSEAFVKAMEGYKKIQDNQADFEREIDNQLRFVKLAKDEAGGTENLLQFVQIALKKNKAKLKKLSKDAEKADSEGATESCPECLNQNYSEQAKLETQISQLEAVVKTLSPSDSLATLCDKAERQVQKLSEAEVMMQNYRSKLFNGVDRWVKDWNKELEADIKSSDKFEKRIKEAKSAEKDGAEDAEKMLTKRAKKDRDRAMDEIYDTCMTEKEPFWSNVPGLGYILTGGARDACRKVAQSPESEPAKKFKMRFEDIKKGIAAKRMDGSDGDVDVFSLLLKQAHAGDLRPGYEMNSLGYSDQKDWLKKVAADNSLEKLGKALVEKKAKFQEACAKKSGK